MKPTTHFTIDSDWIRTFDALCDVVIYEKVDCTHKAGAYSGKSARHLVQEGYIQPGDERGVFYGAYEAYRRYVIDYVLSRLDNPDFRVSSDYYGAEIITDYQGDWAPKHSERRGPGDNVLCAGDACGQIMIFRDFDSLLEYANECLKELEEQ